MLSPVPPGSLLTPCLPSPLPPFLSPLSSPACLLPAWPGTAYPSPHTCTHPLLWLTRDCSASPFPRLGRAAAQEPVPATTGAQSTGGAGFQVRELTTNKAGQTVEANAPNGGGGARTKQAHLTFLRSPGSCIDSMGRWGANTQDTFGLGAFSAGRWCGDLPRTPRM